ncbi:MAG: hypothetical protein A2V65_04215 [Deltaproteobacteria bacterium RBG_13_49_15]|nr:MAG: hypothetical protein A2V65_04215 [Deltaproteobacteria bacterium RBG_13_49_15]
MQNAVLRQQIAHEEFDYQILLDRLRGYARPRDKISTLLKSGTIIRVKKGLYAFGEAYRRMPVSREILANLIYGPSYISLDYALQYHGMIPEHVETVTSVTSGRSRSFNTPFGIFIYRRISVSAFQIGMDRVSLDHDKSFLIATPEKALADKLVSERGTAIRTQKELQKHILENLRVDPEKFLQLDARRLMEIAFSFRSRKVMWASRLINKIQRHVEGES